MTSPTASRIHDVILATFTADSLSLGAHWEYNTDTIATKFGGKVDHLAAPISSYHPTKSAGAQTHIGDNALLLLEHLAQSPDHHLQLDAYLKQWRAVWDTETPPAYVDHATKTLTEALKAGKSGDDLASTDDDLSHSSKFFPLLAAYSADEEALVAATRALVGTFQRGSDERISGEFLARTAFRVIVGKQKPSAAIAAVTAQLNNAWLTERVALGKDSASQSDVDALRSYGEKKTFGEKTIYTGLSCGVKFGIPAVVHYVHRYEDAADPTQALVEDVSVGGNSNARSMAVATLLFGYRGVQGFKIEQLTEHLKAKPRIEQLLATIQQSKA